MPLSFWGVCDGSGIFKKPEAEVSLISLLQGKSAFINKFDKRSCAGIKVWPLITCVAAIYRCYDEAGELIGIAAHHFAGGLLHSDGLPSDSLERLSKVPYKIVVDLAFPFDSKIVAEDAIYQQLINEITTDCKELTQEVTLNTHYLQSVLIVDIEGKVSSTMFRYKACSLVESSKEETPVSDSSLTHKPSA